MVQALDITIHYGLIALLIWTPLAFGTVHPWAYALMEIHIFLLVAAWMAQWLVNLHHRQSTFCLQSPFVRTPFALPLALFIILLVFQLTPLPPAMLNWLSPTTYELYSLFLPDWPNPSPTLSLHPYATRIEVYKFLAYTGLFFLIVNTQQTRRKIRHLYLTIVGVAFIMALIGIMQKLSGTSSIYWLRDAGYASFFGPYLNRNHFAGYQVMAICLCLGLLFLQPDDGSRDALHTWRHRLLWLFGLLSQWQGILVYALALMTSALFLSLSRGGILSFLLGLTMFGVLTHKHLKRSGHRMVLMIALGAMVGMVLFLGSASFLQRISEITHGREDLTWGERLPVYKATWRMAQDFPVLGVGYEAFSVIFPRYQPESVRLHYLQAHNDLLQLLAETGWMGFVILIGGVLLLITDIVKRWRPRREPFVQVIVPAGLAALGAMAFHSLVDFNLRIPANGLLWTAVLALTFASANLSHSKRGSHGE